MTDEEYRMKQKKTGMSITLIAFAAATLVAAGIAAAVANNRNRPALAKK